MNNLILNTRFIGQSIKIIESCDSTNNYLTARAKQGFVENGEIIVALTQLKGRGQRGNQWLSEANKNLTFSVYLKPNKLEVKHQFYLNIIISLAIASYIEGELTCKASIKWPNDIFVNKKKIAGILIENSIKRFIETSVIGIGLNVNQTQFDNLNATSTQLECGRELDILKELKSLTLYLDHYYSLLFDGQLERLRRAYLDKLYGLNRPLLFDDGVIFNGTITGVNELGQLEVLKSEEKKLYNFKEIRFLGSS